MTSKLMGWVAWLAALAVAAAALVQMQTRPWRANEFVAMRLRAGRAPGRDAVAAVLDALAAEREAKWDRDLCGRGRPVVVGFNGNLDLVARADALAGELIARGRLNASDLAAPPPPEEAGDISSPAELYSAIGHFLRMGAAVERLGSDAALFEELAEAAGRTEGAALAIGGNAAIMSERLASLGCDVSFAAPSGPRLRGMQHARVRRGGGGGGGGGDTDEVHLILEYAAGRFLPALGEATRGWDSPRANRFIFSQRSAVLRPDRVVRRAFDEAAAGAGGGAGGVVLSGFHLLDGRPGAERDRLLDGFGELLRGLDRAAVSHVEVASMQETALVRDVVSRVLRGGAARSAGANEQELAALADVLRGGEVRAGGYSTQPTVEASLRDAVLVMREAGLERFHLHSLAFQAVCVRGGSALFGGARRSAIEASLTATTQACGRGTARELAPADLRLLFPASYRWKAGPGAAERFDPASPVQCGLPSPGFECCVAPVLVCRRPLRTVGLGDHISAAGLSPYL